MNLLKALASISSLTPVSRIFVFVREMLITRIFGAVAEADAFFVAFKLPNLLRRLCAEGCFAGIRADFRRRQGPPLHDETRLPVNYVTTRLG